MALGARAGDPLTALWRLTAFRNAYFARGLVLWVGIRIAFAIGGARDPGVFEETVLLGVVVAAVWLDARRRREDLFLGNLGIPAPAIALYAAALPLLAELIVP